MTNLNTLSLIRNGRNLMGFPMTMHGSPRAVNYSNWVPNPSYTVSSDGRTATRLGTGVQHIQNISSRNSSIRYFEIKPTFTGNDNEIGFVVAGTPYTDEPATTAGGYVFYQNASSGSIFHAGAQIVTGLAPYASNSVLGFKLDFGALTCAVTKNGAAVTSFPISAGSYVPAAMLTSVGSTALISTLATDILFLPSGAAAWDS